MYATLAHPHPAPFVQQVGRALFEAGMLSQFASTFVDRPDAQWRQWLCQVAKLLQRDLDRQLQRRAITEFSSEVVRLYPWWEVVRTAVGKIDRDRRLSDVIFHWGTFGFDRWVARHALQNVDLVYGYEYMCLATFQAAKQRGITCVYDVPSPEHDFVETILRQELSQYPELLTPYRHYVTERQDRRTLRRRQEWALADRVIANSEFTKASYQAAGLDCEKVHVIPYGAPPVCPTALSDRPSLSNPSNTVQFLWAGTFGIRKGAHYLLQAWRQLQPHHHAQLNIFGALDLPTALIQNLPDSIALSGTVPRTELHQHYRNADVLVFPTLCDGFGMVVTEAFAQGLPVITTDRAGAADLVRPGENGLIVPAGDTQSLKAALEWCITHPTELRSMRQAALETAAQWQWSDYRRSLICALLDG